MRDSIDIAMPLMTQDDTTTCWLCGEALTQETSVRLRIDGGLETLHHDCGEQVAKSSQEADR